MSAIVRDKARQQLERFSHMMQFPNSAAGLNDLLDAFGRACDDAAEVTAICDKLSDGGLEKAPTVADIRRAGRVNHAQDKVWDGPEKFNCDHCEDTYVVTEGLFGNPQVCGCTPARMRAAALDAVKQVNLRAARLAEKHPELVDGEDAVKFAARKTGEKS